MKPRLDPPGTCDFWAFLACPRVFAELLASAQARGGGSSQIFFGPKLSYVSRQQLFFLDFLEAGSLQDMIISFIFSALKGLF